MSSVVTGAIVGTVVAIVGAVVNYFATRSRDTAQWQREVDMQKARWKREDTLRNHEERLTAYTALLTHTSGYRHSAGLSSATDPSVELARHWEDSESLSEIVQTIRLISGEEVYEAAHRVSQAVYNIRVKYFLEYLDAAGESKVGTDLRVLHGWLDQVDEEELNVKLVIERRIFLEAVHEEEGFKSETAPDGD